MASMLTDQPSMTAIKKAKLKDLLRLADEKGIEMSDDIRSSVKPVRGVILASLFPEGNESGEDEEMTENRGVGRAVNQQLELRKLEMLQEMERERLELESQEREKDRELEREKLEHEKQMLELRNASSDNRQFTGFKISECQRSIPNFEEDDIEKFFSQFEYVATSLNWPLDKWNLILQCKLRGKASRAFASLRGEDREDYDKLKEAVRMAYQLTSEAYRQRFRDMRKSGNESYCDFAAKLLDALALWLHAEEIESDSESPLRELILLEDFKNKLPVAVRVYLEDQGVNSVRQAAELADRYALIHKGQISKTPLSNANGSNVRSNPAGVKCYKCSKIGHIAANCRSGRVGKENKGSSGVSSESKSFVPKCSYCGKTGHVVGNCFAKKRDQQNMVGFVQSYFSTGNRPEVSYSKYMSQASISTDEKGQFHDVTVFRDTGAFVSLIRRSAVEQPELSCTGESIVIQTVGSVYQTVPLHKFYIKSGLVQGEVSLGMVDSLPLSGIDILLGNDLADGSCAGGESVLRISAEPTCVVKPDEEFVNSVYPACVTTRLMSKKAKVDNDISELSEGCLSQLFEESMHREGEKGEENPTPQSKSVEGKVTVSGINWDRQELLKHQKDDESLCELWDKVKEESGSEFYVQNDMLMRLVRMKGQSDLMEERSQIVVPKLYRQEILSVAHDGLFAGHMGRTKTYDRVVADFYWPGMYADVEQYCKTCHTCQVVGKPNQTIPKAKLQEVKVQEEAFSRVQIDVVGPLPRTSQGHQYVLTVMCLTTRFPEAIPLRKVTAPIIARALTKYFTMVGLPREIQSDRGTNFTSKLFRQVAQLLDIKLVFSSAYHPESQGAIERFHQSMKSMLRCFIFENRKDWDVGLPYVLFAIRDAKQESLGFSPFELVYGHSPKGPLQLVKANWLDDRQTESMLGYVARIKDRLFQATELARTHLAGSHEKTKLWYDRKAKVREFKAGDKVLLYLPIDKTALAAKYFGPYEIVRKVNEVGYVVSTPDRRRRTRYCHVNLLKAYHEREGPVPVMASVCGTEAPGDGEEMIDSKLTNSTILRDFKQKLTHLTAEQQQQLCNLMNEFSCLCGDIPSVTSLIEMDIDVGEAKPIKQSPYRMSAAKREILEKEVQYMLQTDILEPSNSEWSSPCVIVPKPGGKHRICADLRQVNQLVRGDAFPLPRIDDVIDQIGPAKFLTKLDLLKGYFQIPLSERAKKILAICTPTGLYQFKRLPFGLKTAPAAFQRLMNTLFHGWSDVMVYLDDALIASKTWEEHLIRLREVLERLKEANLTINLEKSDFGRAQVQYLGYIVGLGQVAPLESKVQAILEYPNPRNRRELRRFLGMVGYYRRFCPNFATVAEPLTYLLKKDQRFLFNNVCVNAFCTLKTMLCSAPVLAAPDVQRPFKLAVDASKVGSGAVLFQEGDDGWDHPVCYFSKKFNCHELNYSTVEKEGLGLIQSLKHFEVYLKGAGHTVTVFTDHNPLTFIHRMKTTNQRVLRWSLLLQDYDLSIQHLPGSQNVVADALSRTKECSLDI